MRSVSIGTLLKASGASRRSDTTSSVNAEEPASVNIVESCCGRSFCSVLSMAVVLKPLLDIERAEVTCATVTVDKYFADCSYIVCIALSMLPCSSCAFATMRLSAPLPAYVVIVSVKVCAAGKISSAVRVSARLKLSIALSRDEVSLFSAITLELERKASIVSFKELSVAIILLLSSSLV